MYIKEIVLATHNKDKKSEMEYALRNLKVKILSLDNFPEIGEIDESGSTLLENSLIKAREGKILELSLERGCLLYHHSCMKGWNFFENNVMIVGIGFDPGWRISTE